MPKRVSKKGNSKPKVSEKPLAKSIIKSTPKESLRKNKFKVALISSSYSPSPILLIMHEMIKQRGYESVYVHIPIFSTKDRDADQITDELMKVCHDADLLAFTCMTNTFIACSTFIKKLRQRINVPVAMGGIHPTAKPMECLAVADYVCIGEGENAFMELIDRLAKGKDTSNIQSFYVKTPTGIIKNPQGILVKDLDSLPVPSFNLKEYFFIYNNKLICMEDYRNDQNMLMQYFTRWYITVTSRGCPYKCKFCINDVLKRLSTEYYAIRKRSPEHIMQELKKVKELIKYPITIGIADDDFFAHSGEEMKSFSELYKRDIALPFFCSSTPHSMQEDKMKYAVEAGLYRLEIGIQSINDKTNWEVHGRAGMRKDVVRAIRIASRYRHSVHLNYDIILDNPWEPDESMLETLNFMFHIPKPCTFAIFSLIPFPGTSQYERAKNENKLQDQQKVIYNNDIMVLKNHPINTLVTLYGKYKVPAAFIKAGIKLRKVPPFDSLLEHGTVPLWRLYAYYEGLKTSVEDKNVSDLRYYIRAPFQKMEKLIRQPFKIIKREEIPFTIETLEDQPDAIVSKLPITKS